MKKIVALGALIGCCFGVDEAVLSPVSLTASDINSTNSNLLDRQKLDATTAKNHTIADALKTNLNVAFDTKGLSGINSGELTPQDFSINGAMYYQNKFLVDSVNFSNDLDPKRRTTWRNHNNIWYDNSIGSQAFSVDTDLLDSIEVLDSDVSAKFGGFMGGVVNTKTRDPRQGFHGIVSRSYTSSAWSKIYKDENKLNAYQNGNLADLSDFTKNRFRAGVEGQVNENLGLLFDFSRATSTIKNHFNKTQINQKLYSFADDKQISDNYLFKTVFNPNSILILKSSFIYSKLTNATSARRYLDSNLVLDYGGYAANLEAQLDLGNSIVEQSLSYLSSHTKRDYEFDTEHYFYLSSDVKNWGTSQRSGIGGYNDFLQKQEKLTYKLDTTFDEFDALSFKHNIKTGLELVRQSGTYEIPRTYHHYSINDKFPSSLGNGVICQNGDKTCVNDNSNGGKGQFLNKHEIYYAAKTKAKETQIATYLEDEMKFNKFKFRLGVRAEKNSDNSDLNIAPRILSEYEIWDKNFIGLGFNRYYGRNFFAYKMYNGIYKMRRTCTRTTYPSEFDKCGNLADDRRPIRELKTPYDDEISLFYNTEIGNAKLGLKYLNRKSHDEILMRSVNEPLAGYGNSYTVFANDGKSKREILTLNVATKTPVVFLGVKNSFEGGFTFSKKSQNFRDYEDDEKDDLVSYNGAIIKKSELPVVDYNVPLSIKFSHTAKLGSFGISNFINYTGKTNALLGGWNWDKKMYIYEKTKLPSFTTWDMRFSFEQKFVNNFRGFVNLDINNLLNKKYKISNNGDYYEYGLGRNFWLEVGVKW